MKRFVITLLITLFALGGCNPFNSNYIGGSIYEIGDNRLMKTAQSTIEGQKVQVVYAKTRDWGSGKYNAYDYVILTMYPKFN